MIISSCNQWYLNSNNLIVTCLSLIMLCIILLYYSCISWNILFIIRLCKTDSFICLSHCSEDLSHFEVLLFSDIYLENRRIINFNILLLFVLFILFISFWNQLKYCFDVRTNRIIFLNIDILNNWKILLWMIICGCFYILFAFFVVRKNNNIAAFIN